MAGRHYYGLNHLHFLTTSTYRRARLFDSEQFKRQFISTLADLRAELGSAESERAGRVAVVELEILLSRGCVIAGPRPRALNRRHHQTMSAPPCSDIL